MAVIIAPSDVGKLATTVLSSPVDDDSEGGARRRLFAEKFLEHHDIYLQSNKHHSSLSLEQAPGGGSQEAETYL